MTLNRGYDPNIFSVSKENKEFALLPNIGRFCKCGCQKQVKGRKVTRKKNNKIQVYYLNPDKDQVFASSACKIRFYNKKYSHKSKSSVNCLISFAVQNDKIPFRVLTLYIGQRTKQYFRITPDQKDLWNALEKLSRYSHISKIDKEEQLKELQAIQV